MAGVWVGDTSALLISQGTIPHDVLWENGVDNPIC